jgi:excinuclease ABC subunit A
VIPSLVRRYRETGSETMRRWIGSLMHPTPCPECGGKRLKPESLAVKIADRSIADWSALSVRDALAGARALRFSGVQATIATPIMKEIVGRLGFLADVGLGYLSLDRAAGTLAGSEAQRIRLATQIGSRLTGVLCILDEPSSDSIRATISGCATLMQLRGPRQHGGRGRAIATMEAADYLVDLGPGAGRHGGRVVTAGTPGDVRANRDSDRPVPLGRAHDSRAEHAAAGQRARARSAGRVREATCATSTSGFRSGRSWA